MTIQELGSLGELIAAIATVITLAYLALQIRQSAKVTGQSAVHSSIESGTQPRGTGRQRPLRHPRLKLDGTTALAFSSRLVMRRVSRL